MHEKGTSRYYYPLDLLLTNKTNRYLNLKSECLQFTQIENDMETIQY